MIDINKYLDDLLTVYTPYVLSDSDQKSIDRDIKSFIAQKLFRKKFRKQKLYTNTVDDISNKINLDIKRDKALRIIILFGGYKHFWNQSASEIDWSEVFTLNFLSDWVAPVVACYKPGVTIEFISEDWILERMNNYSKESLDKYCQSFSDLIEMFNNHLPDNFRFKFTRLGSIFDKDKMLRTVEEKIPAGYQRWNSLNESEKQSELKRSQRSVILTDGLDINRVIESRIVELAYYETENDPEFSGDYLCADDNIYLCFSFGLSNDNVDHWLTLGSTYASTVDFWIGRGILENNINGFVNRIVSKEQYSKIKDRLQIINYNHQNIDFKNLQQIEIIKSTDWQNTLKVDKNDQSRN